ncbi:MAG: thermonuclease family protein [Chloroflexi bacterium]|nr:MAG: thermonuclease family protein [Chloroflexota bacterium]
MTESRPSRTALGISGLLAVFVIGCAGPNPGSSNPSQAPSSASVSGPATATALASESASTTVAFGSQPIGETTIGLVVDVVDGDTIKVEIGGVVYRLRYIGIDTPETVDPSRPVEWMGPEASAANKALVAGLEVVLEKDVSEVDRYGRLLRYVWLHDGASWLMVNYELVRLGFAHSSTYPPDVRYQALFLAAEQEARDAERGLWAPTAGPSPTSAPQAGGCDPSYPTVCIPPPPPDLDCADIPYRRFEVLPPDPHRFDGDGDGIGCES